MATITANTSITVDTVSAMRSPCLPASLGIVAGEALTGGAPCYVKASDGKAYHSNGTATGEAARVHGFAPRAYAAAEPVTLYGEGCIFEYSTGMTPGAPIYLGGTAGTLANAATTGGTVPIAQALTATHIQIVRRQLD